MAEKKVAKKKAAKKATSEKKPRAAKTDGVIGTILETVQREGGASANEILESLKERFPDRGDGMMTTIRIQLSRLPKRLGFELKKTKDETRGLVYKAPKSAKLSKPVEATATETVSA